MQTQKNQTERDQAKFPDPKIISMTFHDRPNDGVGLPSLSVQNHHREQGIEYVQPRNRNQ